MDVHGPPTRLSDTSTGLCTSMQWGLGSRRQSSSRSTRATFEDSGGEDEEDGAEKIGVSQLEDALFTQPSQQAARRQSRPHDPYTPGTDALGKGKGKTRRQWGLVRGYYGLFSLYGLFRAYGLLWTMDYAFDMCGYSSSWLICWWYFVEYMFISYYDVLFSLRMLVKQVKLLRIFPVIRSS
jgi:hypothetical protein